MRHAPELGPSAVATIPGRFGRINVGVSERGVVALEIGASPDTFRAFLARRGWAPVLDADEAPAVLRERLSDAVGEVAEYVDGRRTAFTLPVDLVASSAWDRRVLAGVRQVPYGSTISYGALARLIDAPGAARAVGGAVGRNQVGLVIPCHRVIAGDGTIGGYGGSWIGEREANIALKRALLAHEGVHI